MKTKKRLLTVLPYLFIGPFVTKIGQAWRLAGVDPSQKLLHLLDGIAAAFSNPFPSFHPTDLLVGALAGAFLWLIVQEKRRNAKKYRPGREYGSAR